ncbi:MAG: LysE family translocator [Methylobacteriaceae bacterium]|jgi:threonine/homoserine/homoserine lactone efflux protein|nr:LysE family translocator [Methylobacteriaceae bacterium]
MSVFGFVPDYAVLLAFSGAAFALWLTPGPDMMLMISKVMSEGRAAAFACLFGINAGIVVHAFLAALGVSALMLASPQAFFALKVCGALYLCWLGVGAIRSGSKLNVAAHGGPAETSLTVRKNFLVGLGINLTNPKIIFFFITFLPQFVSAGDPRAWGKLLFLGLYFVVFTMPFSAALILVAQQFVGVLQRRPALLRLFDYLFAVIFISFAVLLLF